MRQSTLCLALACLLTSPFANARLVVFEQDRGEQYPGVQSRSYYVVNPDAAQGSQAVAQVDTYEGSYQDMSNLWSMFAPLMHPISWLTQQLDAIDMMQRAALNSLVTPMAEGPTGMYMQQQQQQQQGSGPSSAMMMGSQDMIRNVACQRFRTAMNELARLQAGYSASTSGSSIQQQATSSYSVRKADTADKAQAEAMTANLHDKNSVDDDEIGLTDEDISELSDLVGSGLQVAVMYTEYHDDDEYYEDDDEYYYEYYEDVEGYDEDDEGYDSVDADDDQEIQDELDLMLSTVEAEYFGDEYYIDEDAYYEEAYYEDDSLAPMSGTLGSWLSILSMLPFFGSSSSSSSSRDQATVTVAADGTVLVEPWSSSVFSGRSASLHASEDAAEWSLVDEEGNLNFELVGLALLAAATVGVFASLVATFLQLRRAMCTAQLLCNSAAAGGPIMLPTGRPGEYLLLEPVEPEEDLKQQQKGSSIKTVPDVECAADYVVKEKGQK